MSNKPNILPGNTTFAQILSAHERSWSSWILTVIFLTIYLPKSSSVLFNSSSKAHVAGEEAGVVSPGWHSLWKKNRIFFLGRKIVQVLEEIKQVSQKLGVVIYPRISHNSPKDAYTTPELPQECPSGGISVGGGRTYCGGAT